MSSLITEVTHAELTVADLDDALDMWRSGLGLTPKRLFTLDEETTSVAQTRIRGATVTLGVQRVELLRYANRPDPRSRLLRPRR